MKPLITVIIPAYNAHDTIQAAIQSIYNTNYDNLEILISDDNSDIGYKYLFKTYPDIKIIRSNINFGAGVARQKAIDIANATSALVCLKHGSQDSMPNKEEVFKVLEGGIKWRKDQL